MKNRFRIFITAIISISFFPLLFSWNPVSINEDEKEIDSTRPPNIILIVGDDVGYEIPNFTGGKSYSTPALNYMAANGMRFTNFYSHPDGSPSRLALYTGKYNFRNYERWGLLSPGEKTIGNMLKDAGYATCFVGKWQLDGGDSSIRQAGFDNYRVFLPYSPGITGESQLNNRYKNPKLYQDGNYMSNAVVNGKYSEDLFLEYATSFITTNKNQPFFLIYSHNLVGKPFVPSPDDADYATWNSSNDIVGQDTKYFPGMVNYMDKMIMSILQKVKTTKISNNTVIMYLADNATPKNISSKYYNGQKIVKVNGAKNRTTKEGTQTPFVCMWPGKVLPNSVDTTLVDFTDMLPTLAGIAGVSTPTNYGILDGISFYDNLVSNVTDLRPWVFCHWEHHDLADTIFRYVHNYNYKLYDSVNKSRFFNLISDPYERSPIPDANLSADEALIKYKFQLVLNKMQKGQSKGLYRDKFLQKIKPTNKDLAPAKEDN